MSVNFLGRLFKRSLTWTARFTKSLNLQIFSLVGYFKETNAFLVYAVYFHETVGDKWCLHKSVRQTENGLERGFVKPLLSSV